MQSSVIDEILSVEDDAAKIVDDARAEAKAMVSEAHDKAARIVSASVEDVKARARAEIAEAEAQLQQDLAEYEEERKRIERGEHRMDSDAKERAVSRVIDRILTVGE